MNAFFLFFSSLCGIPGRILFELCSNLVKPGKAVLDKHKEQLIIISIPIYRKIKLTNKCTHTKFQRLSIEHDQKGMKKIQMSGDILRRARVQGELEVWRTQNSHEEVSI